MSYVSLGVLGFTLLYVVTSTLLGLLRGRNRAILRLVLVLASAVLAVVLIDVLAPIILNIKIKGQPIKEAIASALNSGETALPEKFQQIILTLVEIILGIAVFFIAFMLLRFITWVLFYPILKIFIKKGKKKRALGGMIIGLVQGVLVALMVCAPITGLAKDISKISSIEISGNKMLPIPEEVGLEEYKNSTFFNIYDKTGNWIYKLVSSKKADGQNVSISDTIDVVVATTDIANKAQNLSSGVESLTKDGATAQDKVSGLDQIGQALVEIDNSINSLGDDGKELFNDLIESVAEMAGGEELPPEVSSFIENIDVSDLSLKETGEALQGIASYIEKTTTGFESYGEEVTQSEVNSIVNGISSNTFILDMLSSEGETPTLIPVDSENQSKFESAINSNSTLTEDEKQTLRKLFGIN
jgi:hypothetical protein